MSIQYIHRHNLLTTQPPPPSPPAPAGAARGPRLGMDAAGGLPPTSAGAAAAAAAGPVGTTPALTTPTTHQQPPSAVAPHDVGRVCRCPAASRSVHGRGILRPQIDPIIDGFGRLDPTYNKYPQTVTRSVVQLPTGLAMEVLSAGPTTTPTAASSSSSSSGQQQNPLDALLSGLFGGNGGSSPTNAKAKRPPLVFVHGSFHSAWCWAEHFLPFFAAQVRWSAVHTIPRSTPPMHDAAQHPNATQPHDRATPATPSAAGARPSRPTPTPRPKPSRLGSTPRTSARFWTRSSGERGSSSSSRRW